MSDIDKNTTETYKEPVTIERKLLLIFSAIGLVLGTIIGAKKTGFGSLECFFWMWTGIGGGVALSFIFDLPGIFRLAYEEEGFLKGVKSTLIGCVVWMVLFMIAGPIGFIIRLRRTR